MFFYIASSILFPFIAFIMPKRKTSIELYASSFFTIYFQLLTDVYLHLKLNWYGYFNNGTIEWKTILLTPIYLGGAIIYTNYYPIESSRKKKLLYILLVTIILTFYEWLAVLSGFFYHNQWKYWYSALAYPFILLVVNLNIHIVRRLRNKIDY